jgi:hypothetical protein
LINNLKTTTFYGLKAQHNLGWGNAPGLQITQTLRPERAIYYFDCRVSNELINHNSMLPLQGAGPGVPFIPGALPQAGICWAFSPQKFNRTVMRLVEKVYKNNE